MRELSEQLSAAKYQAQSIGQPGAVNPVGMPLQPHATEIRGLKELIENTRISFDRFAQDVQERITALEMKVGS